MTPWVGVLGTKGWPKDASVWSHPESAFAAHLRQHGLTPARADRTFAWSGDVDGIPLLSGNDWEAGAESLIYYGEVLPEVNIIAHSHGGNVSLLAAARGLRIRRLIMVGTPVRKDVENKVLPVALENIGACLHISDARWDTWGLLGGFGDWRVSFRRTFKNPRVRTDQVKGIGHGGVLSDPEKFPLWVQHGWFEFLTAGSASPV